MDWPRGVIVRAHLALVFRLLLIFIIFSSACPHTEAFSLSLQNREISIPAEYDSRTLAL